MQIAKPSHAERSNSQRANAHSLSPRDSGINWSHTRNNNLLPVALRTLALIIAMSALALIMRYSSAEKPAINIIATGPTTYATATANLSSPAEQEQALLTLALQQSALQEPAVEQQAQAQEQAQPNYKKLNELLAGHNLLSTIVVPIAIDLSYLQTKINEDLPTRLADIDETKVCVKAKWLKTKVPYFDGLKIKSRQLKTKISPEIHCNIKGYINRRGPLSITGNGDTLTLSLPIHARVTAKAGVRETAVADATLFATTSISIDEAWQPHAVVDTDFQWDRRPEVSLFNLVKITFAGKVEPALRKNLQRLEEKIPRLLAKTNIRSDAESAWNDVQQVVKISSNPAIYSHFSPDYVGYTGFAVSNAQLTTQLIIKGQSSVTTQDTVRSQLLPLAPLVHTRKSTDQFRLVVPVIVEQANIQHRVNRTLETPVEIPIKQAGLHGTLTITAMTIALTDAGNIAITAAVIFDNRKAWLRKIDFFNWFSFTGYIAFKVKPELDSSNNVIKAGAVHLASQTDSPLANTLIDALNLPAARTKLVALLDYDFSADIARGIDAANKGLNNSNGDLSVSGIVSKASVDQLFIVDGALALITVAEGHLQAKLGNNR